MMHQCPTPEELHAAFSDPDAAAIREHVGSCVPCRRAWKDIEELASLARALPQPEASEERREELRTSVIARARQERAKAAEAPSRTSRVALAVASLALAAVVLVLAVTATGRRDVGAPAVEAPGPEWHATIHPSGDADLNRAGDAQDEIVRVYDGTVMFDVSPLDEGERFRVIVGDAEVEVHGTIFEVQVEGDRLVDVRVIEGVVEVRPEQGAIQRLEAGASWSAEEVAAVAEPNLQAPNIEPELDAPEAQASNTSLAPPVRADDDSGDTRVEERLANEDDVDTADADENESDEEQPAPELEPADEAAFNRGWRALRADDLEEALAGFRSCLQADPFGALAEDARFWLAVALQRSGDDDAAIEAFREFLSAHPSATRRGEASTALGWLLIDAGRLDEANERFSSAIDDPSSRVSESAADGLETVRRARSAD